MSALVWRSYNITRLGAQYAEHPSDACVSYGVCETMGGGFELRIKDLFEADVIVGTFPTIEAAKAAAELML